MFALLASFKNSVLPIAALAFALTCPSRLANAQESPAPSSREQLNQYVTDLQKNPSDDALREKIIKLALTLEPRPVVPREATEHEGAAEYAFKHVESAADFRNAAVEYEKVLLIAPWAAADYYNLGVCYDKAGDPVKAIAAYQMYLLTASGAKDTDEVVKQIVALKYQLGQRQEQEQATQARQQAQQQAQAAAEAQLEAARRLKVDTFIMNIL
jgi:tetratricopeptide (TPR) repeat protein